MQAETETPKRAPTARTAKPLRLRKAREFARVRQQGRSVGGALLSLGWVANGLPGVRCGYAISKRVGGAVVRNRVKRRLRDILRLQVKAGQIAPGYDLVWIARPGAAQATYQDLAAEVEHLLRRGRLWRAAAPEGSPS